MRQWYVLGVLPSQDEFSPASSLPPSSDSCPAPTPGYRQREALVWVRVSAPEYFCLRDVDIQ